MNKPQSVDTPENWDASSEEYARIAPILMEIYMEEFVGRLDADPQHEALEVAAGAGALTSQLAKKVKSLLATDFSPKMIDIVKQRMQAEGADNVKYEVMDGQDLRLEDNSFDCAASSFGIMLFPDRHKGFAELNRVVRPGGRVMVSGWSGPDKYEGFRLFFGAIQKAFPDMPPPPSPPPVFSLANLDTFKSEMESAGFKQVEVGHVSRVAVVENFDKFWGMFFVGAPPIKFLMDSIGAEGKDKLRDALAEIVQQQYGNGPISMTNVATVGTGVVA
jgi:SAM-dependent methyltransferase